MAYNIKNSKELASLINYTNLNNIITESEMVEFLEKAKECKMEQFHFWKEAKGLGRAPRLRSKQLNKIWGIVKLQNRHLEDKEHVSCLLTMSYGIRKRIAWFLEDLVNVAITTFQKTPPQAIPLLC